MSSPDPGDDLVIDCVVNAGAVLVTENLRDFRIASRELRFRTLRPEELMELLETEP